MCGRQPIRSGQDSTGDTHDEILGRDGTDPDDGSHRRHSGSGARDEARHERGPGQGHRDHSCLLYTAASVCADRGGLPGDHEQGQHARPLHRRNDVCGRQDRGPRDDDERRRHDHAAGQRRLDDRAGQERDTGARRLPSDDHGPEGAPEAGQQAQYDARIREGGKSGRDLRRAGDRRPGPGRDADGTFRPQDVTACVTRFWNVQQ